MAKLLLGIMCMMCAVLFGMPAAAEVENWLNISRDHGIDIWTSFGDGSLHLVAYTVWYENSVNKQPAPAGSGRFDHVVIHQWDANGALILDTFYALVEGDLVVNAGLTRAQLRMPDGGLITVIAERDAVTYQYDRQEHVGASRWNSTVRSASNYARATGTFAGVPFDSGVPHPVLDTTDDVLFGQPGSAIAEIFGFHARDTSHLVPVTSR